MSTVEITRNLRWDFEIRRRDGDDWPDFEMPTFGRSTYRPRIMRPDVIMFSLHDGAPRPVAHVLIAGQRVRQSGQLGAAADFRFWSPGELPEWVAAEYRAALAEHAERGEVRAAAAEQ